MIGICQVFLKRKFLQLLQVSEVYSRTKGFPICLEYNYFYIRVIFSLNECIF